MSTKPEQATPYVMLTAWCTATKAWREVPGKYESICQAEDAATERGIYRVAFVSGGRRLEMEPFARVGGED